MAPSYPHHHHNPNMPDLVFICWSRQRHSAWLTDARGGTFGPSCTWNINETHQAPALLGETLEG